jgi:hypothetical protein
LLLLIRLLICAYYRPIRIMAKQIKDSFKENIISALINSDVQEALLKTLSAGMELIMKELVIKRFDELSASIAMLKAEITQHVAENDQLRKMNDELLKSNKGLSEKCDYLENYQRRDNLIIAGLPLVSASDAAGNHIEGESSRQVIDQCSKLFHDMGLEISSKDISTAHRLPRRGSQAASTIVRFVSRQNRDEVFTKRRILKDIGQERGYKIYINDDLSPNTRSIFNAARKLHQNKRIDGVWTSFQRIKIKKLSGEIIIVSTMADLASF